MLPFHYLGFLPIEPDCENKRQKKTKRIYEGLRAYT
jgi:hypothetical protein